MKVIIMRIIVVLRATLFLLREMLINTADDIN